MAQVSRLVCSQHSCPAGVEPRLRSLRTVLHTGAGGEICEERRATACPCLAGPRLSGRMRTGGHSIAWDWGPACRYNHFPSTVNIVMHALALALALCCYSPGRCGARANFSLLSLLLHEDLPALATPRVRQQHVLPPGESYQALGAQRNPGGHGVQPASRSSPPGTAWHWHYWSPSQADGDTNQDWEVRSEKWYC